MFVRHDAVRTPLQPPYDGPYRVLKQADKHYTLEVAHHQEVVSLDRLKPAYVEDDLDSEVDDSSQAAPTPSPVTTPAETVTRSG